MKAAGLQIQRVEVAPDGSVVIVPCSGTSATAPEATPTDKDDEWKVA
jgi:hypothetical protein